MPMILRPTILAAGLAEREPVSANDSDAGHQRNWRVEIALRAGTALKDKARRQAGGR